LSIKDILETARNMVDEEKRYALELKELTNKFRHPVLQALILDISLDSEKHSLFYNSIVKLWTKRTPVLIEEELRIIREGIGKHIEMENRMIRLTKELAEKAADQRLKMILMVIYYDELKHHGVLVDLLKIVAEREVYTEEELWDAVWKDSPWHGALGG